MRIVLVGPVYPYRGGIAHYTTMLCQALRERGHDIFLISFKRQYPEWLFPGRSDKDPSKKPTRVEDARYLIDSVNPLTWLVASQLVYRYQPDRMILQWWTTFWAPVWLVMGLMTRLILRKQLTFICHNVLPHETRWWDPSLTRLVLRWGTDFIVQSEKERDRLLALLPDADIDIVPQPLYDMFADQNIPREEARRQLGLPLQVPVLLFFGIVREYKGLADVLAALPAVEAKLGKVVLVVAGEIWKNKRVYLDMIDHLGISHSVVIDDRYIPNEEVRLYFSAADVLVAPYRRATGSGVIQVARGFGLPTVSTSQLPQQLGNGLVDTRVQPGDIEALAGAIIEVLNSDRGSSQASMGTEAARVSWLSFAKLIERTS